MLSTTSLCFRTLPASFKKALVPSSICVIGNCTSPSQLGGAVAKNIASSQFSGDVHLVSRKQVDRATLLGCEIAKSTKIKNIFFHKSEDAVPQTDLTLIATQPKQVCKTIKNCKSSNFVVLSAGFGETGTPEGKKMQEELFSLVAERNSSCIGPNCIGLMTPDHASVFTQPIPKLRYGPDTVDFLSGSGSLAVFLLEQAIPMGLTFNTIISVGNASSTIEDVVEYLDENFDPKKSARVKLLYLESITNPQKLLKHAKSLREKGCRFAAIKSGVSSAGQRAAATHNSTIATLDAAVEALFDAAGIIRCFSRQELLAAGAVLLHPEMKKQTANESNQNRQKFRIGIITHAGGPGVLLADALTRYSRLSVPSLKKVCAGDKKFQDLASKLLPSASIDNPINILATSTAEHLRAALDFCEESPQLDATVVIFGSSGIETVESHYKTLLEKCTQFRRKPIFCVLPSEINAAQERKMFTENGGYAFSDESHLAQAIGKVYGTKQNDFRSFKTVMKEKQIEKENFYSKHMCVNILDTKAKHRNNQSLQSHSFLSIEESRQLLQNNKIVEFAHQLEVNNKAELEDRIESDADVDLEFPLVMKAVGPLHKTEVNGVVLNIKNMDEAVSAFKKLVRIPTCTGSVVVAEMLENALPVELFLSVIYHKDFGHLVSFGRGGSTVEVEKDVAFWLVSPTKTKSEKEAVMKSLGNKLTNLRCWPMLSGSFRGGMNYPPVDVEKFCEMVIRLGQFAEKEKFAEIDLNPVLMVWNSKLKSYDLLGVDARVKRM